jgi:hypothetical protein
MIFGAISTALLGAILAIALNNRNRLSSSLTAPLTISRTDLPDSGIASGITMPIPHPMTQLNPPSVTKTDLKKHLYELAPIMARYERMCAAGYINYCNDNSEAGIYHRVAVHLAQLDGTAEEREKYWNGLMVLARARDAENVKEATEFAQKLVTAQYNVEKATARLTSGESYDAGVVNYEINEEAGKLDNLLNWISSMEIKVGKDAFEVIVADERRKLKDEMTRENTPAAVVPTVQTATDRAREESEEISASESKSNEETAANVAAAPVQASHEDFDEKMEEAKALAGDIVDDQIYIKINDVEEHRNALRDDLAKIDTTIASIGEEAWKKLMEEIIEDVAKNLAVVIDNITEWSAELEDAIYALGNAKDANGQLDAKRRVEKATSQLRKINQKGIRYIGDEELYFKFKDKVNSLRTDGLSGEDIYIHFRASARPFLPPQ